MACLAEIEIVEKKNKEIDEERLTLKRLLSEERRKYQTLLVEKEDINDRLANLQQTKELMEYELKEREEDSKFRQFDSDRSLVILK